MGKTYFIADLHLSEDTSEVTTRFLQWLAQLTTEVEAIYILGDFFTFWIGDDHLTPFHLQIQQALKRASKYFTIFLMPGNRDFLLGENFARAAGCKLLTDPTVINLYGKATLLTHGDWLCGDWFYHSFHRLLRSRVVIGFFKSLSLTTRYRIAAWIKHHTGRKRKIMKELTPRGGQLTDWLKRYPVQQIILGHLHRVMQFEQQIAPNSVVKGYVLGAFDRSHYVLRVDENQLVSLIV